VQWTALLCCERRFHRLQEFQKFLVVRLFDQLSAHETEVTIGVTHPVQVVGAFAGIS